MHTSYELANLLDFVSLRMNLLKISTCYWPVYTVTAYPFSKRMMFNFKFIRVLDPKIQQDSSLFR